MLPGTLALEHYSTLSWISQELTEQLEKTQGLNHKPKIRSRRGTWATIGWFFVRKDTRTKPQTENQDWIAKKPFRIDRSGTGLMANPTVRVS